MCEWLQQIGWRLFVSGMAVLWLLMNANGARSQQEQAMPIVDQSPFDRVTLNEANQNAVIDVQLLDLADRKVPDPLPSNGTLSIRRLSDPSTLYEVSWSDVAKIELYEMLVLQEAEKLIGDGKLDDAFQSLSFLHGNYPGLPRLQEATELYLHRDAIEAFNANSFDESLAILAALHDLNPRRSGLARAVEGVSDRLINDRLAKRDFGGAREMLDSLGRLFPQLQLTNIPGWQSKFAAGATKQLDSARQAMTQGDYATARRAVRQAQAILPDVAGADELFAELKRIAPQIVVGVSQIAYSQEPSGLLEWSNERVGRLINPTFVELVRVGPEGGEYTCRWADLKTDDTGLRLEVRINPEALRLGVTPDAVGRHLLRMADPGDPEYRADFATIFASVEIVRGQSLVISWHYPHVKPIAFLQFPLAKLATLDRQAVIYEAAQDTERESVTFRLNRNHGNVVDTAITEEAFANDADALVAMERAELDILDQVPPWQVKQADQLAGVGVSTYRMPTVHVLLCNYDRPLLSRREFRRAITYGIDRPRLVAEILAGKDGIPGFRAVSGPLLAGVTVNDVIGYAYKQELQHLPYEPRLAVVLSTAARTALAKRALESTAGKDSELVELPKPEPLVLVHPNGPTARSMCVWIKRQLDAIGIPVELKAQDENLDGNWDLRYAELCMWEPVVDVHRLLGPAGLAGKCSPTMSLALNELNRATNWSDARSQLQRVHQVAFDELPVIPLWQTLNYFAYREALTGIQRDPVSLYQSVGQWQVSYGIAGNEP